MTEPRCPPSVSDELWEQVPPDLRNESIVFMAKNLRRAFHPEVSLKQFIKNNVK